MPPSLLSLEGATVRFGGRAVLDDVGLGVAEHEVVCVLGPSGSGKSTLLRAVAGLQPLDAGRVTLDGRDQSGVPAHKREVGLMFQDHQLFPQRDVAGNIAFGRGCAARPGPSSRPGWRSCCNWSDCRAPPAGPSPRSPAGSSSGWPWPARSRPGHGC